MHIQGIEVPKIGFGTFGLTGSTCKEGVKDALSIGYRHIDTARMYGNEEAVGQGIAESGLAREAIFLTTKLWHDELKHDQVISNAEESLQSLKTDYLDLLLIHWPSTQEVPLYETLEAFQQLKSQGKVKQFGVSNFPAGLLEKALAIAPIFCNQVEYHPYLGQERLLKLATQKDLLLTGYCPLGKGKVPEDPNLTKIGEQYGKTASQVALRWLYQQPNVAAIPRSGSHEHRVNNFDIFDFSLNEEEVQAISALNQGERMINPAFAPEWN